MLRLGFHALHGSYKVYKKRALLSYPTEADKMCQGLEGLQALKLLGRNQYSHHGDRRISWLLSRKLVETLFQLHFSIISKFISFAVLK